MCECGWCVYRKKEYGNNYIKKFQVKEVFVFAYCQSRKIFWCYFFPANLDLKTALEKTWSLDKYVPIFLLLYILEEVAFFPRTVAAIIQFLDDIQLVKGDGSYLKTLIMQR